MTIAMGIVFVLLLGEIDLSVGYVSGVGGAIVALLTLPGGHFEFAGGLAIVVVLVAGLLIGTLNGLLFTKVGIPSFVVTLAGLLAWNGAVLLLIGDKGTIVIQSTLIVNLANGFISDAAVVGAGGRWRSRATRACSSCTARDRARAGLPLVPVSLIALRVGAAGRAARRGRLRRRPGPRRPLHLPRARRAVRDLVVGADAQPLRPPRLRGRRQPGGGAARGHRRRPRSGSRASRSAR